MKIKVRVDTSRLEALLKDATKRTVFATANALNKTALEIQAGIRQRGRKVFNVREGAFIDREIAKIEKYGFANPKAGRFSATVHVVNMTSGKRELLLAGFERGQTREPFVGEHVAIPVLGGPARRTARSRIPHRLTFEALNFHRGKGGTLVSDQGRGFYIVPGVGVFERMAYKSRAVYLFADNVRLDPRLEFIMTARRIAAKRFAANVREAVASELEQAQNRGQIGR